MNQVGDYAVTIVDKLHNDVVQMKCAGLIVLAVTVPDTDARHMTMSIRGLDSVDLATAMLLLFKRLQQVDPEIGDLAEQMALDPAFNIPEVVQSRDVPGSDPSGFTPG